MAIKTIGFFGDSFCSDYDDPDLGCKTYIQQTCDYFNLVCVNLGVGGSSAWDLYLQQFQPLLKKNRLPDVCVMTWTEPYRLYHSLVRDINYTSAEQRSSLGKIWHAARQYYIHLMESDKMLAEYTMLQYYFDREIASKHPRTRFIHMWSFGYTEDWCTETFRENRLEYTYNWQHGAEIQPSLMHIAVQDGTDIEGTQRACADHLDSQSKHDIVAETLIAAIENYTVGSKWVLQPKKSAAQKI